ncbi:unnamed protein product [Bursaphelenchus okinawaensis]|uniref:Uncharacterized protein n=1 Tax=Bursaphelenchus okinawaensis TaxID=465554 RepID=A0A811KPF5_9BILA|nr:unnamed protein product [Bursaphelenchus okinawaensis]CAG9107958.1 unnamed protein product [Bursaphelenchus okinawaensis]
MVVLSVLVVLANRWKNSIMYVVFMVANALDTIANMILLGLRVHVVIKGTAPNTYVVYGVITVKILMILIQILVQPFAAKLCWRIHKFESAF